MITEDYVSFEIAKLLKEKGFDEPCHAYYEDNGTFRESYSAHAIRNITNPCFFGIASPTHQMAMKWLREVHKIYIDISPTYSEAEKTTHFIWQIFDSNYDSVGDCDIFYPTYEEAVEEAIQYSLEHLI